MRKFLIGLLVALACTAASSFTLKECNIAAQNVYNAQNMLNSDPAAFKMVHEIIKSTPPEVYDWSAQLKDFIVRAANSLKEGGNPEVIGNAALEACKRIKET
jgi:hypothetical protein